MIEKTAQKAPNLVPEEGNPCALFVYFSSLWHPWGPKWFQDPPKSLWEWFLYRFWSHLGSQNGAKIDPMEPSRPQKWFHRDDFDTTVAIATIATTATTATIATIATTVHVE